MDIRERIADTVEVECWCCKYHENYPMNFYKEPIKTPLCLHHYELADKILAIKVTYELADKILAIKVTEDRECGCIDGVVSVQNRFGAQLYYEPCGACQGTGTVPGKTLKELLDGV